MCWVHVCVGVAGDVRRRQVGGCGQLIFRLAGAVGGRMMYMFGGALVALFQARKSAFQRCADADFSGACGF